MRTTITMTVAVAALAACGGDDDPADVATASASPSPERAPLMAAVIDCEAYSAQIDLMDDGATLAIDGMGAEHRGADFDTIECLLDALDAPDSVWARMGNTRALDGTQDATWGSMTARWTYHPDSGIQIIIEDGDR